MNEQAISMILDSFEQYGVPLLLLYTVGSIIATSIIIAIILVVFTKVLHKFDNFDNDMFWK